MSAKSEKFVSMVSGLALFVALLGAAGCRHNSGTGPLPTVQGNAAVTEGRRVFAANDCVNCHGADGQGSPRGPALTHTGANPTHTMNWFIAYVHNPRPMNPASRMPPHPGISRKDLLALAGYLSGLK